MWISGLQKVLLGRFLGPKFGDLGVQFGDLGTQIEVPEGPLGAVLAIQKPALGSLFVASWDIWNPLRGLASPALSQLDLPQFSESLNWPSIVELLPWLVED